MTKTRRPRPAVPRSIAVPRCTATPSPVRRAGAAALALTGLLSAAACSGSSSGKQAAEPVITAEPAALSPSYASPSGSTSPNGVVALTPDVTAKLDAAVQRVLTQTGVPGINVGIITPGGTYLKSFGVADKTAGTAMDPSLHLRIGSETKTFTATAVLRLVDQGKVGLDDPISKYVDGVPGGDGITVRELGEMRSGLFPYSSDPDFVNTLINDPNHVFTPDQLLAYGYKHPAVSPPGTQFQYNNSNYIILGKLVEKLGGQPAEQFITDQVITPASLSQTSFPSGTSIPSPYAHGYTEQTPTGAIADATNWDPSWAWTAGAIVSTVSDLESWAKTLATGTLVKPATQVERLKALPTGDAGVGYGFGLFKNNGWIGHNGSLPGYESVAVYLPQAQSTLALQLNTDVLYQGSEPSSLFANEITKILSPKYVYSIPPSTAAPSAPASTSASGSASGSPSGSASGSASSSASTGISPLLPAGNSPSTVRA
ncbi:serine hydrolase domain-containing protein [Kitasatospora sp. NPDC059408]|uniref:serine hydrolase domain-containing protein n=1 Tax=Kitasatospora sp. NPDC059408 TaxID=3346823 RepID=UPI00368E1E5F